MVGIVVLLEVKSGINLTDAADAREKRVIIVEAFMVVVMPSVTEIVGSIALVVVVVVFFGVAVTVEVVVVVVVVVVGKVVVTVAAGL